MDTTLTIEELLNLLRLISVFKSTKTWEKFLDDDFGDKILQIEKKIESYFTSSEEDDEEDEDDGCLIDLGDDNSDEEEESGCDGCIGDCSECCQDEDEEEVSEYDNCDCETCRAAREDQDEDEEEPEQELSDWVTSESECLALPPIRDKRTGNQYKFERINGVVVIPDSNLWNLEVKRVFRTHDSVIFTDAQGEEIIVDVSKFPKEWISTFSPTRKDIDIVPDEEYNEITS